MPVPDSAMRLIIVSGLSGSGKSIALHTLEDCGFYCIDNLPVALLDALAFHVMREQPSSYEKIAIGIDSRNHNESLAHFSDIAIRARNLGIECEILFLHAENATLLKRFSETRRKHPLTTTSRSLAEAIELERELLKPVAAHADLLIDTTQTTIHQLRELLLLRVSSKNGRQLSLFFQSFGFKHGIPQDTDFVFDARCLPNPHWEPALRCLTGRDPPVAEFLAGITQVQEFLQDVTRFLRDWVPRFEAENRSYLTVAVGCTGGQHRSVYLAEKLADRFREIGQYNVLARHRELSA